MVLEHLFETEGAGLTNSISLTLASCLQCSKCCSDIWHQPATATSYKDRVIIGYNEECLWLLQIYAGYGQFALIKAIADALGNSFNLRILDIVSKVNVCHAWIVLSLAR